MSEKVSKHSFPGFAAFLLFCLLGVWSYLGTLDYVTVTQGVVTPSNKIKKILGFKSLFTIEDAVNDMKNAFEKNKLM